LKFCNPQSSLDCAGIDIPGTLLFRTLIGKIFGSIGSVGGGLALGKEGPLVHTGACIASLLGQGGSTKYHLNSRWPQLFKSDRDRRDLLELLLPLEPQLVECYLH
jgi:chloride channel 7